jgi:NhaP-type Na+/H+ or K+/H+ antiporter
MVWEKYPDSGCPPADVALMRKVHRPGMRFNLATKCPLARRVSFSGWSAPAGVIAVALAVVMGSSLPDAWKNVK